MTSLEFHSNYDIRKIFKAFAIDTSNKKSNEIIAILRGLSINPTITPEEKKCLEIARDEFKIIHEKNNSSCEINEKYIVSFNDIKNYFDELLKSNHILPYKIQSQINNMNDNELIMLLSNINKHYKLNFKEEYENNEIQGKKIFESILSNNNSHNLQHVIPISDTYPYLNIGMIDE